MIQNTLQIIAISFLFFSCSTHKVEKEKTSASQEKEIKNLIEQLVFDEKIEENQPVYSPGIQDTSTLYRQKFETCQKAFYKLMEHKEASIPYLTEHLDDKRQSINFRNHFIENDVGSACYWNLYAQLQDRPNDYSEYGYQRMGKDGKLHPKPYWEGTPFDSAGGIKNWLKLHKNIGYTQKQIICLNWLLEKEMIIGADDAESYFINILPLEIRILERKLEIGEDVNLKLKGLKEIQNKKLVDKIPTNLLPANYNSKDLQKTKTN